MNALRISGQPTRRDFLKSAGIALISEPLAANLGGEQGAPKKSKSPLRWKTHEVAKIPDGYQVAVSDVTGDGKLDILALSSQEHIVEWYENPSWKARPITTKTSVNISLAPLFLSGQPSRGVALATDFSLEDSTHGGNLWWAVPPVNPEEEWPLKWIGHVPTSHRLRWADLDGDGRMELVDAPILGPGAHSPDYAVGAPLTWFAIQDAMWSGHASAGLEHSGSWEAHLIDDSLTVVHGLRVVDWDGVGRAALLTASFEGVHLFQSTGRGKDLHWTKIRLGVGDQSPKQVQDGSTAKEVRRGSSEIGLGRAGGRRFLATIEPWHGEQVVVYVESHPEKLGGLWDRHVIDSSFHDGHALACADLDGDGNDEIVAGFRGPGTSLFVYSASDAHGLEWTRQTLDTAMAASGLAIDDINGDGRLDVVAIGASTGNVKWYENLG